MAGLCELNLTIGHNWDNLDVDKVIGNKWDSFYVHKNRR